MARHTRHSFPNVVLSKKPGARGVPDPGEGRALRELMIRDRPYRGPFGRGLRVGRHKLVELLRGVPCLSRISSGDAAGGFWWVRFDLDITSPIAWNVVRRLGLHINTESAKVGFPIELKPTPEPGLRGRMRWDISSRTAGLDPAEVERWLRAQLPQPIGDPLAWLEDN